jgi:hypothetical protein
MTKSQKAMADFKSSPEYAALVTPSDDKAKTISQPELETRIRRAFAAGWISDRDHLGALLDEIAGSQPAPAPKK